MSEESPLSSHRPQLPACIFVTQKVTSLTLRNKKCSTAMNGATGKYELITKHSFPNDMPKFEESIFIRGPVLSWTKTLHLNFHTWAFKFVIDD